MEDWKVIPIEAVGGHRVGYQVCCVNEERSEFGVFAGKEAFSTMQEAEDYASGINFAESRSKNSK